MASITFRIDGCPVGKQRPRVVNGHAFTPQKTVDYENAVRNAYRIAARDAQTAYFTGAVKLTVYAGMPIPAHDHRNTAAKKASGEILPTKKPDWDNIGKIISDALNGLAYRDDSQIVDAHVVKRFDANPHVLVEVGDATWASPK